MTDFVPIVLVPYAPLDSKSALVWVMLWWLNRYQTIIWTDIDQMMFVTEGPLGPNKLIVTGEFPSQRASNEEMF